VGDTPPLHRPAVIVRFHSPGSLTGLDVLRVSILPSRSNGVSNCLQTQLPRANEYLKLPLQPVFRSGVPGSQPALKREVVEGCRTTSAGKWNKIVKVVLACFGWCYTYSHKHTSFYRLSIRCRWAGRCSPSRHANGRRDAGLMNVGAERAWRFSEGRTRGERARWPFAACWFIGWLSYSATAKNRKESEGGELQSHSVRSNIRLVGFPSNFMRTSASRTSSRGTPAVRPPPLAGSPHPCQRVRPGRHGSRCRGRQARRAELGYA
jgi:hypothetical protein